MDFCHADVIIAGAGPIGCATAHAFADQGSRVLMLEMGHEPVAQLGAELVFPPALQMLERWGVELPPDRHVRGTGVTLYEHGGGEPIELRFPTAGQPVVMPYPDLVNALRASIIERMEPEMLHGVEVLAMELDGSVHATRGKYDTQYRADHLVGADGRHSVVRHKLYGEVPEGVTAHTATALLEGTGAKGYEQARVITDDDGRCVRIHAVGPDLIRVALDLPTNRPPDGEVRPHLEQHFLPLLPQEFQEPILEVCEDEERIAWTASGFRHRTSYEHGRIAMVGDAVGHVHPLFGIGITVGILDGLSLAHYGRAKGYGEARLEEAEDVEWVTRHFYQALMGRTPGNPDARRLLHEHLRRDPVARRAAMWMFCADGRATGLVPLIDLLEGTEPDDEDEADDYEVGYTR
ncbi:FAD-dependent oxidoreductase [Streptomyces sp. NPDC057877]|uniref:FAD-dependent oxidoreductase n=1 Tax=Streptomyces sp. NPDC057877 TaxID=3346269 RepID=UPI0036905638